MATEATSLLSPNAARVPSPMNVSFREMTFGAMNTSKEDLEGDQTDDEHISDDLDQSIVDISRHHSVSFSAHRTYGFTPQSKRVEQWNINEVLEWFLQLESRQYYKEIRHAIMDEYITGSALIRLNDADLKQMGLSKIGHRKMFLAELEALKKIGWSAVMLETILPSGSILSASFNLCSAVLGAGALSLPFAYAKAGVFLATSFLLLGAIATLYTIHLLIYVFEQNETRTYEDSITKLAGQRLARVVDVLAILFCFGTAVAYIIVLGDVLLDITRWLHMDLDRNTLMVVFWLIFMLPTTCLKRIDSLRMTSFVGVVSMLYISMATAHFALVRKPTHRVHTATPPIGWQTCVALPIVLFAFSCQVNVWPIYDELKGKNMRRKRVMMMGASGCSLAICAFVYISVGYAGFSIFGDAVDGNLLNSFEPSQMAVARLFMAITIASAFPMNFYPMRQSINQFLYKHQPEKLTRRGLMLIPVLKDNGAHFMQTLFWATLILLCGLLLPNVNVVFQLVGSVVSSSLCFILPAILKVLTDRDKAQMSGKTRSWSASLFGYIGPGFLIVFGIGIGLLGTSVTLANFF